MKNKNQKNENILKMCQKTWNLWKIWNYQMFEVITYQTDCGIICDMYG